jgi:hypothetical protein
LVNSTRGQLDLQFSIFTHRGFSARLRAFRDWLPVLNKKVFSSHTPHTGNTCGAPARPVVASQ